MSTESSGYLPELDVSGSETVASRRRGQGRAPEAEDLPPAVAVGDAEPIPMHWADVSVVDQPWTLQVDVRGGIPTVRRTTVVRQVVADSSG